MKISFELAVMFCPIVTPDLGEIFLYFLFPCLFVCLFILGRKLNRQNCLLKEVLREREEKEEKEKKKSN